MKIKRQPGSFLRRKRCTPDNIIRHEGRARERKSKCERFFSNSKMTFPCDSFKPFKMHCWLDFDHIKTIYSLQDTLISIMGTLKLLTISNIIFISKFMFLNICITYYLKYEILNHWILFQMFILILVVPDIF